MRKAEVWELDSEATNNVQLNHDVPIAVQPGRPVIHDPHGQAWQMLGQ